MLSVKYDSGVADYDSSQVNAIAKSPPVSETVHLPEIVMMENHDAAYHAWRERGLKDRILVHMDDHHDMWWIESSEAITIANYICPAMQENIAREVYWIVPDPRWYDPKEKALIIRQVKRIVKKYPGPRPCVNVSNKEISTKVLGRSLKVGPLASIPHFDEDVLLDIDTDYLLGSPEHDKSEHCLIPPWCKPEEIIHRLKSHHVQYDLVTIAYSVEGGYTPLSWKFLGDEIAARLKGSEASHIEGFERLYCGVALLAAGKRAKAEGVLLKADERLANLAAPQFLLSELYADDDRISAARDAFRLAVARDPSYRTAYRNGGLSSLQEKRYAHAQRAFQRGLMVDPEDAVSYFGLGRLAAANKQWKDAESLFRKALELKGDFLDANRSLGDVLSKQCRYREAISAYEKSLSLSLAGHKPLDHNIITETGRLKLVDQHHFDVFARLGRSYAKIGEIDEAINSFRFSIAGRNDKILIRWDVACLYAQRFEWQKCAEHLRYALQLLPRALLSSTYKAWRRLLRMKTRIF
jgi:tetratricopeptide (TPR) repeat protein